MPTRSNTFVNAAEIIAAPTVDNMNDWERGFALGLITEALDGFDSLHCANLNAQELSMVKVERKAYVAHEGSRSSSIYLVSFCGKPVVIGCMAGRSEMDDRRAYILDDITFKTLYAYLTALVMAAEIKDQVVPVIGLQENKIELPLWGDRVPELGKSINDFGY